MFAISTTTVILLDLFGLAEALPWCREITRLRKLLGEFLSTTGRNSTVPFIRANMQLEGSIPYPYGCTDAAT
jgi:hypothetical protein